MNDRRSEGMPHHTLVRLSRTAPLLGNVGREEFVANVEMLSRAWDLQEPGDGKTGPPQEKS